MSNDDHSTAVITLINNNSKGLLSEFKNAISEILAVELKPWVFSINVQEVDAVYHWLKAGTPDITQGCPISPPIPVEQSSASGRWKLQFPQLPDALKNATGKDV